MLIRNVLSAMLFASVCSCGESTPPRTIEVTASTVETPRDAAPAPSPSSSSFVAPAPVAAKPMREPVVAATVAKATAPTPPDVPGNFKDAMELGRALTAKGDAANARVMFTAAAKLDKHRAEPHIELARSFIAADERALAIAAAKKAVAIAPDSTAAWNTLGRAELLRKQYDAAIAAFQTAVELDRDNAWAWNNLGFVQLETKHYDAALTALVEATSRPTATGYMFNNLGTAYEQLGRLDEAREAFDKGGKLGSVPALASRKRLEGVKTVAIAQPVEPTVEQPKVEMPEMPMSAAGSAVEAGSGMGSDASAQPTTL